MAAAGAVLALALAAACAAQELSCFGSPMRYFLAGDGADVTGKCSTWGY